MMMIMILILPVITLIKYRGLLIPSIFLLETDVCLAWRNALKLSIDLLDSHAHSVQHCRVVFM